MGIIMTRGIQALLPYRPEINIKKQIMITLKAKIRTGKDYDEGSIPAILYGPGLENVMIQINRKDFEKAYEVVEETLMTLEVDGKNYSVLIYDMQQDPVSLDFIHVDFYQPNLKAEVETEIELEIVGEAPAVKNLGGTLITNIKHIKVKALPKDIPNKLKIDVSGLNTFEDHILIKDIKVPAAVKVMDDAEEIVVQVTHPENVDEELAKPVEGKVAEPVVKSGEEAKEGPAEEESKK
jgi:large subunit ribosomal protein L25